MALILRFIFVQIQAHPQKETNERNTKNYLHTYLFIL